MEKRVLFVDDEENVLSAVQRTLRGECIVDVAKDADVALDMLRTAGPFPVIVSDMRMPGMNGADFLAAARRIAPDSVRIMLTGNADQKTAIDAVNKGEIFRFLNKPTKPEVLKRILELAFRQYQLVTAERELLEKTLNGSIKLLTEVLAITSPEIFGRTERIRTKARAIAAEIDGVNDWEIDTAASLGMLGCIGLRSEIVRKYVAGKQLDRSERMEFISHPLLAAQLVSAVPRMEGVADILHYQHEDFDGNGFPKDGTAGEDIPMGARIMHLVLAYDELKRSGSSDAVCYEQLSSMRGRFDPVVMSAFGKSLEESGSERIARLDADDLRDEMVIQEDVVSTTGALLVCEGQRVTPAVLAHLAKFVDAGTLTQQILVLIPTTESSASQRSVA